MAKTNTNKEITINNFMTTRPEKDTQKVWVRQIRRRILDTARCLIYIVYYYMATHPALLSRNLIGWPSGRIAPSCQMDSAAKQNWNRMFNKIVSNSRKTSENYKTWGNAFNKTRERLFFGEFSASFRTIFGKFENQQKTLEKWFWTIFVKNIFRRIVSKLSVNVRNIFVFAI